MRRPYRRARPVPSTACLSASMTHSAKMNHRILVGPEIMQLECMISTKKIKSDDAQVDRHGATGRSVNRRSPRSAEATSTTREASMAPSRRTVPIDARNDRSRTTILR